MIIITDKYHMFTQEKYFTTKILVFYNMKLRVRSYLDPTTIELL